MNEIVVAGAGVFGTSVAESVLSKKFVKRFHVFVIKFQRICQKVVLFSYVFGCLNVFIDPKIPVQTDCHKIATGLLYRQYWRLQAVY